VRVEEEQARLLVGREHGKLRVQQLARHHLHELLAHAARVHSLLALEHHLERLLQVRVLKLSQLI